MPKLKVTRVPAVAGMFYPADPQALQDELNTYLYADRDDRQQVPKAIIVPHAGIVYSGPVAATAFRTLLQYRHVIRKVILIGPAHRVAFSGLAVPHADRFQTPLGEINLDTKTIQRLVDQFPLVHFSDAAHADEHSLEVQLPFLQSVLAVFRIIPILVGDITADELAAVIDDLWGGEECLILISSDLSHYHPYHEALQLDTHTATLIEAFRDTDLDYDSACGKIGISALLQLAQEHQLRIERFDLRNSGDTAGPQDQVVGYGAWGLFQP